MGGMFMTESEKLDLILKKLEVLEGIQNDITDMMLYQFFLVQIIFELSDKI
jgi:hypothetical protein